MGEAKRKRQHAAPSGVPVEDFTAQPGEFALTVDVEGAKPESMVVPWPDVHRLLAVMPQPAAGGNALETHRASRRHLVERLPRVQPGGAEEDEAELRTLMLLAMWTVFEHPAHEVHRAVSDSIRRTGKAHVTASAYGGNFAVALADKFVDLESALRLAEGRLAGPVAVTPR
jgi:hypothetical protein